MNVFILIERHKPKGEDTKIEKELMMVSAFRKRSDIWYTLLLVGLGAAGAGAGAAFLAVKFFYYDLNPPTADIQAVCLAASLTALVVGPLFWWRGIIHVGRLSIKRGMVVGILGSLFIHLPTWYLAMMVILLGGGQTIFGFIIGNPLMALLNALGSTLYSLIFVGWITVLIGGIAGGLIALMQRSFHCQQRWEAAL